MAGDDSKCANVSAWENGREADTGLQGLCAEHLAAA